MIVIEVDDPKFDDEQTQEFLTSLGGESVQVIREPID